jgi:predicted DNA-binding transcriptional regulator YafY
MRADRLVATLLLLQTRGRVTAADVARELEVSLKTARRDLEALSLAGLPVYSQPGKGGGWQLLGGARTDLSGLTSAEARTLFLVAGPSSAATPAVKAALRKLVRALPETFRAGAEAAASALVLDPTAWGRRPEPASPHLEQLQQAVIDRVQVHVVYPDAAGGARERLIHPLGLVAKGTDWYLVAGTPAGQRTFRVSRIRSLRVTDQPAQRPDGFELQSAWRSIAATIEERRTHVQAQVRADAAILAGLQRQFGTGLRVGRQAADGRYDVQIGSSSARVLAAQLAGWGTQIEVRGPDEIRRHLARIGAELVAAHRGF